MAILNLTNQIIGHDEIVSKLSQLESLMDERKVMWEKLSIKQKKSWLLSQKDPIMSIAWDNYKYLDGFFEDIEDIEEK